jgi:hypothetical protein
LVQRAHTSSDENSRRKLQNVVADTSAKQPTIGKLVDEAMVAIERDNPRLKGVLPKDYARPALDKHRLGELIDERSPSVLCVARHVAVT